ACCWSGGRRPPARWPRSRPDRRDHPRRWHVRSGRSRLRSTRNGGVTVLQAALNGSWPADAHPLLPVTARHLARDARAVAELNVTSVHVHPRDPQGLETLDPVYVGDTVAAIRAQVPSMEI